MYDVNKVIQIALNEVGYLEKRNLAQLDDKTANAGSNNYTKYARDLDAIKGFYNGAKQGFAWCFTEGTKILTDNGYKNIEDIDIGDKLLNAHGDRFNAVTRIAVHDEDVIDVRVYGALPFSVTPDHPFLSQQRLNKWHRNVDYSNWGFTPIGDLNPKDTVAIPHSPLLYENRMTYDDLWVLGYYVGDGYCTRGEYILCGNDEKSAKIEMHADARRDKDYPSRTCAQYVLRKKDHAFLFDALSDCGIGAANKRVPKQILFGTNEAKRAFLEGYFDADGFENKFNTVSSELATGIARLIFDLGYGCSINPQKRPPQGKIFDKRLNAWRTFNQQEYIYNGSVNTCDDPSNRIFTVDDKYAHVPIKKKSEETHTDTVYTITTDGDHTYTANNIGVHNCDVFVDWCFVKAYGVEGAKKLLCQPDNSCGAGCTYSLRYYQGQGKFVSAKSTPQKGDQVFFGSVGNSTHTGLVVDVKDGKVFTVEGNTSGASGVVPNGGGVCRKSYPIGYSGICGYGRPNYGQKLVVNNNQVANLDNKLPTLKAFAITLEELKKGAKGKQVKALQQLLVANGCACGTPDGEFGSNTENGVKEFQRKNGLTVDGIAGEKTWNKLLK